MLGMKLCYHIHQVDTTQTGNIDIMSIRITSHFKSVHVTVSGKTAYLQYQGKPVLNIWSVLACQWW